jgi:putative membrane protein
VTEPEQAEPAAAGEGASAPPPPAAPPPALESAPRRTLLAAERTYLAWLRTGLGVIGLALAVGRLLPALLTGSSHRGYALLGAGYGVLGLFFIAYALVRAWRLESALARREPVTLDWWALVVVTAAGLVLAVATIALVLLVQV